MCPGNGTPEEYAAHPHRLNDHHAFGPAALAFGQALRLGIETMPIKDQDMDEEAV
jgi:unsaturated rhamnogalacturonyl hydrolase